MVLADLLSKDYIDLPINYTGYYEQSIRTLFSKYKDDIINIENINDVDTLIKDITYYCNTIEKAIQKYIDGYSFEAHKMIFDLLESLKSFIMTDIFTNTLKPNMNGLYKIRNCNEGKYTFSCNDNFVIPYSEYNMISTHRFSIPGFPCLYLGTSSYLCSLEVPKQDNTEQIVSRYELWDDILNNTLYLNYLPKDINTILQDKRWDGIHERLAQSYLRILPILITIYHKVQKEQGPFRPEYLISQIITEWCRNNDIQCICYLSTRYRYDCNAKWLGQNFAFPIQTPDISFENVNEFKAKFYVSKPVLIEPSVIEKAFIDNKLELRRVDDYGRYCDFVPEAHINGDLYLNTIWGKIDLLLQNMENIGVNDRRFKEETDIRMVKISKKYEQI